MKLPSPPRAVVAGRCEIDAKRWRECAIDPRAFGGTYDTGYRETCIEDGVAFVHICGPLDHHQGWWFDSYDSIAVRVEYALADPEARAVVVCFDSPGGDASGVEETHQKIKDLRATYGKPVFAYSNEACYSAAYWLACAADGVWLPPTGGVGSVGVIAEAVDVTAMNAKNGVRVELVTTGKQKADGHPERPLTDEILARVQARVDQLGDVFFASVAKARKLSPDAVEALQAACLIGESAAAAGLADGVASWDDFLADVRAGFDTGKKRATTTGALMQPTEKILTEAITAARAALASATDETLAACVATLSAAIEAKVKYSKRVRTDELEEDDGKDDDGDDDSKTDNDKPPPKKDADSEDDEDASEEDESKALAALGGKLGSRVYGAIVALTGKRDLSEALGALEGIKARLGGVSALEARVAALETGKRTERVNSMIAAASVDGKIAAGSPQAQQLAEQGLKDPKWLKGYLASLPKVVSTAKDIAVPRENVEGAALSVESMSAVEKQMYEGAAAAAGVTLEKFLEAARATASKMAANSRPTH